MGGYRLWRKAVSNYRRARAAGGTFFFTVVTYRRQPVLIEPRVRQALREAVKRTREMRPFEIRAWILLPDHMHCVWTLPQSDGDYSARWSMIKAMTTRTLGGAGRNSRREGGL